MNAVDYAVVIAALVIALAVLIREFRKLLNEDD